MTKAEAKADELARLIQRHPHWCACGQRTKVWAETNHQFVCINCLKVTTKEDWKPQWQNG